MSLQTTASPPPAAPWFRWRRIPTAAAVFAGVFGLLLGAGWFGVYGMGFIHADALARSANAYHVLFSRDPHLAAIGLFWPPLPSALQIPLMPLVRPFGSQGIVMAGVVISAAFAAGFVLLLHRFLVLVGVGRGPRIALLAAGLANPLLLYYMISGATELPFLFFVVGATYFLIQAAGRSPVRLAIPGLFLAGAVLTRYEGLAAAAVIALASAFIVSNDGIDTWAARSTRVLTTSIAPLAAFAFWVVAQWQIEHDPLYFVHTAFSGLNFPDTARQAGAGHLLFGGMGSIPVAVGLAAQRAANLSPAYVVGVLGLTGLAIWRRDRAAAVIVLAALSVPAFHAFQIFTGRLGPYTRYWIDFVPWAIPILGYLLVRTPLPPGRQLRRAATVGAVLLLAVSAVSTTRWMHDPPPAFGANFYDINELYVTSFWNAGERRDQIRAAVKTPTGQADVARFLDERYPNETILIDQWHGHPIIMQMADPTRVVMTNDRDFFDILRDPIGKVDVFAVAYFDGVSPHVIEEEYPGIWQLGRPWLVLDAEIGDPARPWRLYRVVDPAAAEGRTLRRPSADGG